MKSLQFIITTIRSLKNFPIFIAHITQNLTRYLIVSCTKLLKSNTLHNLKNMLPLFKTNFSMLYIIAVRQAANMDIKVPCCQSRRNRSSATLKGQICIFVSHILTARRQTSCSLKFNQSFPLNWQLPNLSFIIHIPSVHMTP